MRHRVKKRPLGRKTAHRRSMLKNLATSLIVHGELVTTKGKAKELRRFVEPLITKAGTESLANTRQLAAVIEQKKAATKLRTELGPKYKDRPGGYVRLVKLGTRPGDGATSVKVQLV